MGLLKGIDPLLTADLLHVLRSMGHGDKLCICDANFPTASMHCHQDRHWKAHHAGRIVTSRSSWCDLFHPATRLLPPLDHSFGGRAWQVAIIRQDDGTVMPEAGVEVIEALKFAITQHAGEVNIRPLYRWKFYDEASKCFAVVQTAERRPFGNVILTKGVIGPDGKDLKP